MMHLAVSEDDIPKAESLVARVGKDYADSVMFAVAHGDSATLVLLRAAAESRTGFFQVANAARQVSGWLHQPAVAEPFARAAAARPDRVVQGNRVLAGNLIAQGRWTAADSALAVAQRAATSPWARIERGLWATLPFLAIPRAQLEAIRADVAAWDPAKDPTPPDPGQMLPQIQRYVLALLASRLGEREVALREAAQLETAQVSEGNQPLMSSLAAVVRADVALGAHRPADALKALAVVRGEVPLDLIEVTPFSEDYARFLRGEALLATGNDDEALRWLQHGFDGTPNEMAFRAQVSFRLGDIYERKGERQKAIDSYSKFVRLWAACDPRLQPAVEDARARLARLTAEPRS
jgi:tetratricopeptide (TPR) repeat protein